MKNIYLLAAILFTGSITFAQANSSSNSTGAEKNVPFRVVNITNTPDKESNLSKNSAITVIKITDANNAGTRITSPNNTNTSKSIVTVKANIGTANAATAKYSPGPVNMDITEDIDSPVNSNMVARSN